MKNIALVRGLLNFVRFRFLFISAAFCLSFCVLLLAGPRTAAAAEYPLLVDSVDSQLQAGLQQALASLGLQRPAREGRLAVALVDISDLKRPRVAAVNGDRMMYAASLPKIAILFGLYKRIEAGDLLYTRELRFLAEMMVRYSSNQAASRMYQLVGPEYIGRLLVDPSYRLYDIEHGGGLWIGKEYGKRPAWKREPIRHLSHAATAMKVARFYYLLETGRLVAPALSLSMKQVLSRPGLEHKFVKGLHDYCGPVAMFRKSGSWHQYHSDSALVLRGAHRYIAVSLVEDDHGSDWLEDIIVELDRLVVPNAQRLIACRTAERSLRNVG